MSEFLARHGAHIIVLGGPLVLAAGVFAALELTRPNQARKGPSLWIWLLALGWAAGATTHAAVIGDHFGESVVLGSFFLVLTLAQYSYAIALLLRPSVRLLVFGLAVNLSVVLLWGYSRTVAIPFGLGPREPVGAADLVATLLEVATVAMTLVVLRFPRATAGRTTSQTKSALGRQPLPAAQPAPKPQREETEQRSPAA